MTTPRVVLLVALAALGWATWPATSKAADYGSPRQYYSSWAKHPKQGYSYRKYYYKPSPGYAGYKHHYVIHKPSKPKHVYYYNPYKKQYWGRCELQHQGQPRYSLLPPEARKGRLDQIPESAFPEPGELPPIPESEDGVQLDLPPDDLPQEAAPAE